VKVGDDVNRGCKANGNPLLGTSGSENEKESGRKNLDSSELAKAEKDAAGSATA